MCWVALGSMASPVGEETMAMRSSNCDSESTPEPIGVIFPVAGWARNTALALLMLSAVRQRLRPGPEAWAWLGLGGLLAVSALASANPESSLFRAYAFWMPAVAGLFCARNLLGTQPLRLFFFAFLTALFAGLSLLHLIFGPKVIG